MTAFAKRDSGIAATAAHDYGSAENPDETLTL
jgi:hypothetical protein